jgi:hypothetical protein
VVRCWGWNSDGQLNVPIGIPPVMAVAAGGLHTVAIDVDGRVRCWGQNGSGQLNVPQDLGTVTGIAAGGLHTIALTKTGEVRCWGESGSGQCAVPLGLGTVSDVAAGNSFSLALTCGLRSPAWHSSDLGPFGFTAPAEHLFTGLPTVAAGPVELHVAARGDLDLPTEFLAVTADGTPLSTLFSASGSASDCPSYADRATITISPATYAALAADGEILVRVAPSNGVSAAQCANGSLELVMVVPEPPVDCNGNGINDHCEVTGIGGPNDCDNDDLIDSCEIAANPALDCDGDSLIDACDIAYGEQDKDLDARPDACEIAYGDLDLDGIIGGADLGGMLSLWGFLNPPYGDLNRDGNINGADLGIMLTRWGPVP